MGSSPASPNPHRFYSIEAAGTVVFASPTKLTVLVPESASGDSITVTTPHGSTSVAFTLATLLAENLHPVANPAVDEAGNIYVTFSGSRGQSVPTSLFRIDDESTLRPIRRRYHESHRPRP